MADVGQEGMHHNINVQNQRSTNNTIPAEDFEAAKAKALKIGAVAVYVEDLRREFCEELCFQSNAKPYMKIFNF